MIFVNLDLFSVLNIHHFHRNLQSKIKNHQFKYNINFKIFRKTIVTNPLISKKKDQEKFNEYAINTDDAWEIDDRTMTLKILDNDNNGDDNDSQSDILSISKQVFYFNK